MINPAETRAKAPVVRLARFESLGREDEEYLSFDPEETTRPVDARILELATCWRRALSAEKYNADPKPVRMTEGNVPRHRCLMVLGPLTIS